MKRWSRVLGLALLIPFIAACQTKVSTSNFIISSQTAEKQTGEIPDIWSPLPRTTFDIQFSGDFNEDSFQSEIVDLDLFETSKEIIEQLHNRNKRVFCYFSAGSWEKWREDADNFPSQLIGKNYTGWPGEKWLDIRQIEQLSPILSARFDMCKYKGFDGVETDNVDGYQNNTGFSITAEDQLAFNRWLTNQAHVRGLSIGLKNDPDQILDLVTDFDWLLLEDCFAQDWCNLAEPFRSADKAIFAVEYTDQDFNFDLACDNSKVNGITLILKNRNLDGFIKSCD
jgi:hypothetical protein